MDEIKKDTFCVLPWMHLATNASGNLRVCCNSDPHKNNIKKPNGSAYQLQRDDLKEAWNSPTYQKIREELISGVRPEMCIRCFREEDTGVKSARQSANEKWGIDKVYPIVADFNIRYVDVRLSNLCNLKCRMCNPYASNMWTEEWSLIAKALSQSEYDRLNNMNWPELEKTWENLYSIADTIEEIYLTGGEPTIIKAQHKLLDYFINKGTAKNIRLKYNTNLTNIPKHLLDRWTHFKRVQLNCSIDAIGELDRYIRFPSSWQHIQENFEKIRMLKNCTIEIHCTVQMYNILRLNELIDWALPYNHRIYFNILNHPEELNVRVLPKFLKDQATKLLDPYLHLDKVKGIIDYMNAEDWSHLLINFHSYTNALDKSRNQNLAKLIPELSYENTSSRK